MNNMFQNLGNTLWSSSVLGRSQRTSEEHQAKMKQMAARLNIDEKKLEALLRNKKVMNAFREAQTKALGEGRTIYGSYGYGRGTKATTDPYKQAGDISNAIVKMENAGVFDEDEDLKESLKQKAKDVLSEADAAAAKAATEAKLGFSPEGLDPIDRDIRLGGGLASLPKASKTPPKTEDNRGLFTEGVSPFDETAEYEAPLDKDLAEVKKKRIKEGVKTPFGTVHRTGIETERVFGKRPLASYFQAGTETVPEENIPKTFQQIGLTDTADQEIFQKLEKAAPELDLRGITVTDPQGFKQMLAWLRVGKTPTGKPFTIKDAIKMLQSL